MSTIHDQAMNYVYQQILQRLLSYFSRAERTALQLLIQRLVVHAGGMERLGEYKVLTVQTGARNSVYTLALLRAAQLSIAGRAPATFQLRVATLRCNSMREAALDNMQRSYSALFLHDDPRVELLMVDHREVLAFNHQAPLSAEAVEADRLNLLLMGHRRHPDEAFDMGVNASLATAEFYGQVTRWGNGVDALLVGESLRWQRQFIARLACAADKAVAGSVPPGPYEFDNLFTLLDGLGNDFYREFYPEADRTPWRPEGGFEARRRTSLLDIHDMLVGNLDERWPLLTDFLEFRPDEAAPGEGDGHTVTPLIAAHLRGLHAQFIGESTYEAGFSEQVHDHLAAMRERGVPEPLCEQLMTGLDNLRDPAELRLRAAAALQQTYGVNEVQLTCLLFAPFNEQGAGLERFLRACHPGMLVAMPDLHRAMQGLSAPDQVLQWMTEVSGIPVRLIGRLYSMEAIRPGTALDVALQPPSLKGADVAMSDVSAEG